MVVINQVMQGQHQLELTPHRPDRLHGREHHIRLVLIELKRRSRFQGAGRRTNLHMRQIRQHLQLAFIANHHHQLHIGNLRGTGIHQLL